MTIEAGDTVEIIKGAEVFEGYVHGSLQHFDHMEVKVSARKSKIKVESVIEVTKWWNLLSKDEHKEITDRSGIWSHFLFESARGIYPDNNGPISYSGDSRVGRRWSAAEVDAWLVRDKKRVPIERQPEIDTLFAEYEARVRARFGDLKFVVWSNDKKATMLANAVPAEAAAPKAPKEATITKRRLMVEGSVWKFTADFDVMVKITNPALAPLHAEKESYRVDRNSQHQRGGTRVIVLGGGREQTQAELDAMARIQKQIDALPERIEILGAKVKAGTRVKLIGKPEASSFWGRSKDGLGLMVPMMWIDGPPIGVAKALLAMDSWSNPLGNRGGGGIKLPYSLIEKNIEAESVPEDIVWVLRDKTTGEFFGGWLTEKDSGYNRSTDKPKISATFSGSKKYKNLSALKASIMDFTGYMSGIEEEGYRPEWVGSDTKKIDLPDTWEAVAIDKTTNAEKRVEDVQEWYANLMRLKVLTVEYGSAVRTVYKKIEKRKDEFAAIVVFKTPERWEELEPNEKRAIDAAMENNDGKAPSAKNEGAQAYAVKSQIDATMILLAYSGTATAKAFDVANLKEIVPDA